LIKIWVRNKQHPHSYTENKILNELQEFDILFKKKSPINAQFCRFITDKIIPMENKKELILVMRLNK